MTGLADAQAVACVLGTWFPAPAQVRVAPVGPHALHPQEATEVARAVKARRDEFATGRWLASLALGALGYPRTALGVGRLREPLWCEGVRGSISHDGGVCAVVVAPAPSAACPMFGIDLMALSGRIERLNELASLFVSSRNELQTVEALGLPVSAESLLFSIKESAVKAISHRVGDFIDLRSIDLTGVTQPELRLDGALLPASIHCAVTGRYLVTCVALR